jgi:hypothetical protein
MSFNIGSNEQLTAKTKEGKQMQGKLLIDKIDDLQRRIERLCVKQETEYTDSRNRYINKLMVQKYSLEKEKNRMITTLGNF